MPETHPKKFRDDLVAVALNQMCRSSASWRSTAVGESSEVAFDERENSRLRGLVVWRICRNNRWLPVFGKPRSRARSEPGLRRSMTSYAGSELGGAERGVSLADH